MSKAALIRKRLGQGVPKTRIAEEIGCDRSYVYLVDWMYRSDENYRRYRRKSREWARNAYRARMERSPPPPPREWTDEEHATALEMKRAGKSASEIATALNRSKNSVIGRFSRAGA